ncbi:MAG: anthranilate phosphoribosyltransferase [Pseudomonadales bacterium]|nr:anthranilate phosphoribosyltransferase [Pseudomonadales bacterium]
MTADIPIATAMLRGFLERLLERQNLSEAESVALLRELATADVPPPLAGAVLAALRAKGVVAAELRGFALAMRSLARRPDIPTDAVMVDIVGTGGDASGSLNLSTGAALLTAACGVGVVKHGNRSVSSRCGSADVLECLGLGLPLDEQSAGRCFSETGFTFLFAPHYHPAMKAVAPIRQALGVRTIFNILGPLTNPAQPPYHVLGAFDLATARLMAATLAGLPTRRGFVIHGADGWDEPTPIGPFRLFDVRDGAVTESDRSPEDYGLARCTARDLAGGDAVHNAAALGSTLSGEDRGPHRDALLLGAALALEVTGNATGPRDGVERAAKAIESGAGGELLRRLARFKRA